jgi:hypothetical protein
MGKKLTDSQKLDLALKGISEISKRVNALEESEETNKGKSKGSVKSGTSDAGDVKDLLPYSSKPKILKDLKISELKEIIPKSDFMDKGFNLTYKEMIEFFKSHSLGGRPWITAQEQIDYFILPLKKAYKINKAQWNKKLTMMRDETKAKLITAETNAKKEGKKWTDNQVKANGYKVANLQNILKSISEIK